MNPKLKLLQQLVPAITDAQDLTLEVAGRLCKTGHPQANEANAIALCLTKALISLFEAVKPPYGLAEVGELLECLSAGCVEDLRDLGPLIERGALLARHSQTGP